MKNKILFCPKCKEYTLREVCPLCNSKTANPVPPKYSVEDKYASYRRTGKKDDRIHKGLIQE